MENRRVWRGAMLVVATGSLAALVYLMLRTEVASGVQMATQDSGSSTSPAPTESDVPPISDSELAALKAAVEKNPEDTHALVNLANLLYDGQRFADAIPLYRKALEKSRGDVNISTDLGTALWYTGKADEAIAQFEQSLAIDRNHAQTLYNMGIVKLHGKNDLRGAIDAWEKLLAAHPDYPKASKLRSQMDDMKKML
ncbi:MAG: tetratricopeptide repeat protein [Acidobacteriota bacterium]